MRTFTSRRLLLSAVAILALLTMGAAQTFYFHVTPVSTAGIGYETLVGSASPWVRSPRVRLVRHHAGGDRMTIGVLLKTSDLAEQQALIKSLYHANSASYHQWLSAARFNARFTPLASEVRAVQKYLTGAGLRLVASPAAALILANGTVSQ
ncbi:MAG TPA: protease pro-enzyme activation domain-containing protein, partial [Ktedonobacteraceae bacterium]|nr:protease pro-enzyme activation domain-containing protein [Ktedonobacteraceae bacterium]